MAKRNSKAKTRSTRSPSPRAAPEDQGTHKNIPGRDGRIHLNEKYLECLGEDQAIDLFDTMIHESLHLTRPPELQVPPEFDHDFVVPETKRKTEAARDAFLKQRRECTCKCQ